MGKSSGTGNNRHLVGSGRAESLRGGEGWDVIEGRDGNDRLYGAGGNDQLYGGRGNDLLYGGDGHDFLHGGAGRDRYDGGRGFDTISFSDAGARRGAVADLSTGRIANDGFGNAETLANIEGFSGGTLFGDRFTGNAGGNSFFLDRHDRAWGLEGDDSFVINGAASINGGAGHDIIAMFTLETYVAGKDCIEVKHAEHGVTVDLSRGLIVDDGFGNSATVRGIEDVRGSCLADKLTGDAAANVLLGSEGNDTLSGLAGKDTLWGESGDDLLIGGSGDDWLIGETGRDTLEGGSGADNLHGGSGRDVLTGGSGADYFVFDAGDCGATRGSADVITDFSHSQGDKIDFSFIDLGNGKDDCFSFVGDDAFGGGAAEIRFDHHRGNTYVYADIDGDKGADLMIKLEGMHELVSADFVI